VNEIDFPFDHDPLRRRSDHDATPFGWRCHADRLGCSAVAASAVKSCLEHTRAGLLEREAGLVVA
jgi:hypothetical protein